ncbi:MAG: alpha/beta fold hydrolase [Myxococcales bacterium]|nr:alpha/beta fold hydrolase [Myxococcales bacterium]
MASVLDKLRTALGPQDVQREAKRWKNLVGLARRKKPAIASTPHVVVHRENKWSLLRYERADKSPATAKTPVLLVPSLINRHYVLDLAPQQSMVEDMVRRGHDVFVIDWGTPGPEDRFLSFDDVCDRAIGRAMRVASSFGSTDKCHLLGYCMGGTLAVIYASVRPERVASLTALAAPVRFDDDGLLARWVRSPGFDVNVMVDAMGLVPWQLMQPAFHMLRPTLNLWKAVQLVDKAWDDEFLDSFLAVETWGNDNVSLPGEFYRRYIDELYRCDALAKGEFLLSGRPAKMSAIDRPVMAITFEHDNIVPWRSAAALLDEVKSADKVHLHQPGGHVGAVVSKKASQRLWPKLSAFWTAHD